MGKIIPKKEISFKPAIKAAYLSNQNIHFWNFLKRKTHPQNKIQFPGPPLTLSKKGNPQIDGNGLPKKEIRKRCIKNHSHWLSVTLIPYPIWPYLYQQSFPCIYCQKFLTHPSPDLSILIDTFSRGFV